MAAVCSHVATGASGLVSLKVIRKAVVLVKFPSPPPPKDITVPPLGAPLKIFSLFQFTPIDGSPQLSPIPAGDMWIENDAVVEHVSGVPVGAGVGVGVGVGPPLAQTALSLTVYAPVKVRLLGI